MKRLTAFFKQFPVIKILATLVLGATLLMSTACSNENLQGARPNNPPVQMGGQNNPYKQGGDGYTDYKMTTDPKVIDKSKS